MKTYYVFNKRTYKPPKGLPLWALDGAIAYVGRPTVFGNPYICLLYTSDAADE